VTIDAHPGGTTVATGDDPQAASGGGPQGGGGCARPLHAAAVVLALLSLYTLAIAAAGGWQQHQFEANGATAETGRAREKFTVEIDQGKGTITEYRLRVVFTDEGGAEHECVQGVGHRDWEKYKVGDPVPPFEYLKSRPSVTRRVTPPGQWKAPLPFALSGLALTGLLWLASRWLRRLGARNP
jgi:hypothetical protein